MSIPRASNWFIDSSDATNRGLLRSFDSREQAPEPRFGRNQRGPLVFRIGEPDPTAPASGRRPFRDIDLTGAQFKCGIGQGDEPPTSGTWGLSYNGTDITGLDFDISAADLKTAIEGHPDLGGVTIGGCEVVKTGALYTITFANETAVSVLTADATGLYPASAVLIVEEQEGGGGSQSIQSVELRQLCLARANEGDFTIETGGTVDKTQTATGSTTTPAAWKVTATPEPLSGSIAIAYGRKRKVRISVNRANTAAGHITTVVFSSAPAQGEFLTLHDSSGPVVVYFDYDAAGTDLPVAPTGGRLLGVFPTTGDTVDDISEAFRAAVHADPHFNCTAPGVRTTAVTCTDFGERNDSDNGNLSGVSVTNTAGNNGALDGEWAAWSDRNGTVAVWISSNGSTIPEEAAAFDRQIAVNLTGNETADVSAEAIKTAIEADAEFTATRSANLVDIVDASDGARSLTLEHSTWLSIAETRSGGSLAVNIPVESTVSEIAALIGSDQFTVTELAPFSWIFTRTAPGAETDGDFTATASEITWPNYAYVSDFACNSLLLRQYLALISASTAASIFELKMKLPGEQWRIILQIPCTLFRDILSDTEAVSLPYESALTSEALKLKVKALDESRTTNNTPSSDNTLFLPLTPNCVYKFRAELPVDAASNTPDWKGGISFPAAPAWSSWSIKYEDYNTLTVAPIGRFVGTSTANVVSVDSSDGGVIIMEGTVKSGATAGNIAVHWSQNTSHADATTVKQGASLMLVKEV